MWSALARLVFDILAATVVRWGAALRDARQDRQRGEAKSGGRGTRKGDATSGSRATLMPWQVDALRVRVEALKEVAGKEPSDASAGIRTDALLYLVSLIQEAEATREEERRQAQEQRRVALDSLRERLGCVPKVGDLEARLSLAIPFDEGLRSFLRSDLETGPGG